MRALCQGILIGAIGLDLSCLEPTCDARNRVEIRRFHVFVTLFVSVCIRDAGAHGLKLQ